MMKRTYLLPLVLLFSKDISSLTPCKTCQSPPSDDITLCRCDDQCTLYSDCCPDHSAGSPVINDSLSTTVEYMECRSRYRSLPVLAVGDAYYMVSSCPSNWTQDEQFIDLISNNCTSTDPDIKDFPPVSDPSTGITYRNEFCAICHNVNTPTLLTWPTRLQCEGDFKNISQTQNITLELIYQYCSRCSFDPPNNTVVMDTLRWCIPVEAMCPPFSKPGISDIYNETEYEEIVDSCTNGEYNPIHEANPFLPKNIPFLQILKNSYCTECNSIPDKHLSCVYPTESVNSTFRCTDVRGELIFGAVPFSALLDVTGNGVVRVTSSQITETQLITCDENQLFDPVAGCRDIICPSGFTPIGGICTLVTMATPTPTSAVENVTNITNTTSIPVTLDPLLYINCTPIALNEDEYTLLGNNTVLFRDNKFVILGYDDNTRPLICVDFNMFGIVTTNTTIAQVFYAPGIVELTYVGISLSITASIFILLTYSLFKEFRTLPSQLLMNFAITFILSDCALLLSNATSAYIQSIALCETFSILLHCSFLARFSWMNCMGIEYTRTFLLAIKLRATKTTKSTQNKRLVFYMLCGWGIPFFITMVTVIVNFTVEDSVRYGRDIDNEQGLCWINNMIAIVVAFVVPIFLAVVLNFILFFAVVFLICVASHKSTKEIRKRQTSAEIRVVLGIFMVLGLTWVFGFIALLSDQTWAWYPFIILNSNQPVLIAICFLSTKKILLRYKSLFKCIRMKNKKTTATTIELDEINSISKFSPSSQHKIL